MLEIIGKLYKIEEEIRGLNPEERKEKRQTNSKELVEDLFDSFKKVLSKLAQKGSTALAIKYALNHEIALKRFLEDGKIEIDNHGVKWVAVTRFGLIFSQKGAQRPQEGF